MKNILACDPVQGIRSANTTPPTRSLRADILKPIRLETRWRAVDPHLKKYCCELSARLMDSDGQRQRAPKANVRVKFELAVEVIVCNLVALALSDEGHRSIAIIKANHASSTSPIYGKPFNRVVELMEEAGLVTVVIGYNHSAAARASSSITATPAMKVPAVRDWSALSLEDHERRVVLHTGGKPSPPPPGLEHDVIAINTALCMANVEVAGVVAHVAGWPSTITDRLVTPQHRQLHRVFNENFKSGGRLFGGWWQTLPRDRRGRIRIGDGSAAGQRTRLEPVVNVDFSAMHLMLAYAEAGKRVPHGDLYDLTRRGHERHDWHALREGRKQLVSVMFMSKKPLRQWPGATPREREDIRSCFPKGTRVKDEIAAIRERHKAIADWFECGRGLSLQRTESDILVAVLLKLIARGITALPIHDAVLVARSHGETAQRIMEAEAKRVTGAKIPAKISECL